CHRLQAGAWLAELDAAALDLADAEALADELVDVDAARDDVASRLARLDRDAVLALHCLDGLGGDQRQCRSGRSVVEEVAVAFETAARESADRLDGLRQVSVVRTDVDALNATGHRAKPSFPTRRRPASRS